MEQVKWGVLGTAGIAKGQTIPGMMQAENCCLYAIAGRDPEKVKEFQSLFGFEKGYTSYEMLLQDPDIQAVYIPLPNTLHCEWVLKALRAKKHVLCEKPLAPSAKQAEELFAAAKESGVHLMEAFAYLHSPWIKAMKEELDRGTIGKVLYAESQFLTSDYDLKNIRMRRETNGGALYDLGCYNISMLRWLLGRQPAQIEASAIFTPEKVDRLTTAVFSYEDGAAAGIRCGMVFKTEGNQRNDLLRIAGAEGTIVTDGEFNGCGEMSYTILKGNTKTVKTICVPHNYRLEVEQLGRCITDGEQPHVSAAFSLDVAQTTDRILAAIGY